MKIGKIEVSDEIYEQYKLEKSKWYIFHLGLWWFGCAVATFLALLFWFKFGGVDKGIYQKAYVQACKDYYSNSINAELVSNENGEKHWKYSDTKIKVPSK